MFIHDIYVLGESKLFELKTHEEATINLELKKTPPCYNTILSGKVLYKNLPIKNATVMIMDINCRPVSSEITDDYGNYMFRNLLKPGKYKAVASAIGYNPSSIKLIQINENEETKLSFALQKSLIFENGIVYGKVTEAGNRNAIKDADIYLKASGDDYETTYKTSSNHNGQYIIYNILPNNYKMTVRKHGYMANEPIEIKVDKHDRIILYFDLIKNSADCKNTISGIITFEENPISNAAVFLYFWDKQKNEQIVQIQETNENGFFLFSNVESGLYLVKGKLQNNIIYEESFTVE